MMIVMTESPTIHRAGESTGLPVEWKRGLVYAKTCQAILDLDRSKESSVGMMFSLGGKQTLNNKEQGKEATFKDKGSDSILLRSKAVLELEIILLPQLSRAEITSIRVCN